MNSRYFEQANASFINIAILLLLIFSALFGIILYFLNTIEKKNRKITHQNKELAKLSITDALTGLMNRHGFREQFSKLVDIAKRHNEPLSVIMMDIDYFKEINDQCGHAAGDLVLETISKLLTKYQRTSDLVCRWGGEEFLIAQAKNDATEAAINAERIRVEIEKLTIPAEQREIKVTASFGIATLENSDRMESLINRADTALYDAKENGRNRVNTRL